MKLSLLLIYRLGKLAATTIASNLESAKSLHTLDLSFNPITAEGAFAIVNKLRNMEIKLRNLLMDNVEVNKEFVKVYLFVSDKKDQSLFRVFLVS